MHASVVRMFQQGWTLPACRSKYSQGVLDEAQTCTALQNAQRAGISLTPASQAVLGMPEGPSREQACQRQKGQPLVLQTCITCMGVINKTLDEVRTCALVSQSEP